MGFLEVTIGAAAVVLWLVGVFLVVYRGYITQMVRTDELKFEVAERRGLFSGLEPPPTSVEALRRTAGEAVGGRGAEENPRRYTVWKAWREDPSFKAEVRRRYREYYPPYRTEFALFCGGAWSLAFLLADPLRDALVPDGFEVLVPVYALVAPLWIAVAVMTAAEALKSARRRADRKVV